MSRLSREKYNELFRLRAEGKLESMECTKTLFKLVEKIYTPNMELLDIPCGAGHYLRKLRELGQVNYLGIERDEDVLKIAIDIWKDEPNTKFMLGDVKDVELPDNSKDVVFCYNLILHLEDYKKAISELIRVSKKYVFIRSLFGDRTILRSKYTPEDYKGVFPEKVYYNSYERDEVIQFVESIGKCKARFIKDNPLIPTELIQKQVDLLKTKPEKFTTSNKETQQWGGMELDYEVLVIEKGE